VFLRNGYSLFTESGKQIEFKQTRVEVFRLKVRYEIVIRIRHRQINSSDGHHSRVMCEGPGKELEGLTYILALCTQELAPLFLAARNRLSWLSAASPRFNSINAASCDPIPDLLEVRTKQ
jgi:hypothetical protein